MRAIPILILNPNQGYKVTLNYDFNVYYIKNVIYVKKCNKCNKLPNHYTDPQKKGVLS